MSGFEIGASALLKASNAYTDTATRKTDMPKGAQIQSDTVSFQKMASQQLNKFSKMNADQILAQVRQTNAKASQSTSTQSSGILASNVGQVAKAIKADEDTKKKYMVGDASLTEVIEATTEAKTTLQTAIAVRNKVLETFEKIMNMPI